VRAHCRVSPQRPDHTHDLEAPQDRPKGPVLQVHELELEIQLRLLPHIRLLPDQHLRALSGQFFSAPRSTAIRLRSTLRLCAWPTMARA
jgi:hypothetical protein